MFCGIFFLQASQKKYHGQANSALGGKVELPNRALGNRQDTKVQEKVDDSNADPKRLAVDAVRRDLQIPLAIDRRKGENESGYSGNAVARHYDSNCQDDSSEGL